MFRNQYILADYKLSLPPSFSVNKFHSLFIYSDHALNTTVYHNETCSIFLLGFIIDPFSPEKDDAQILKYIAGQSRCRDSFFETIQRMSGRYVSIFKSKNNYTIIGDACCLRQMYLSTTATRFTMSSSPKLFLVATKSAHKISEDKQAFIQSPEFRRHEHSWFGSQCIDDRLLKILPNHYFDVNAKKIKRIPLFNPNLSTPKKVIDFSVEILKGSIRAAAKRYNLIQPVTAGWDTRILLAATRGMVHEINFYIFQHLNLPASHPDLTISQQMMQRLGIPFHMIAPTQLKAEFLEIFREAFILPRILTKTAGIQYHFYHNKDKGIVNINGNCGAITRCHFGVYRNKIAPDQLPWFTPYQNKSEFVSHEIMQWSISAQEFAKRYAIPLLDLFYWECRTGNWAPIYPFEQDIAIEEFSPFNNRALLYAQLLLPAKIRNAPKHRFFYRLIETMWPATLDEPINPKPWYAQLRQYLKRNARMRYWKNRILSE